MARAANVFNPTITAKKKQWWSPPLLTYSKTRLKLKTRRTKLNNRFKENSALMEFTIG